ncbi:uncharacterized protein H6S33_005283 [Morchella sextelata]|uniref:uncharacterized protein n=1 Tax=Morchella sextelata TaxID=1174677 RepID=UPI001D038052|nr:uncharacterized protein H6S33_005283 [Morchella sextelata]KAH0605301.1 hypothetical protein H6S33_005283 [Morchella sextelata]
MWIYSVRSTKAPANKALATASPTLNGNEAKRNTAADPTFSCSCAARCCSACYSCPVCYNFFTRYYSVRCSGPVRPLEKLGGDDPSEVDDPDDLAFLVGGAPELRMERSVFEALCRILEESGHLRKSRYVSVQQQVHVFIYIVSSPAANRNAQSRFQHSDTLTPTEITLNTKLYPYFKDCIGAIDGSLVPARVAAGKNSFAYRCPGWEGAANDSGVLDDALSKGFTIQSPNRYCLADAGYGLTPNFLTPYRRMRYHLKEFSLGDQKPQMLGSLADEISSYNRYYYSMFVKLHAVRVVHKYIGIDSPLRCMTLPASSTPPQTHLIHLILLILLIHLIHLTTNPTPEIFT